MPVMKMLMIAQLKILRRQDCPERCSRCGDLIAWRNGNCIHFFENDKAYNHGPMSR